MNAMNIPENVLPGSIPENVLVIIEDTMNATMRECVMVDQFIEQGDMDAAGNALVQIRINAAITLDRLETAARAALSLPPVPRSISAHDAETLPPAIEIQDCCIRCKRTAQDTEAGPHGEEWVWMLPRQGTGKNLCSDCINTADEATVAAIQAMDAAAQALINRLV